MRKNVLAIAALAIGVFTAGALIEAQQPPAGQGPGGPQGRGRAMGPPMQGEPVPPASAGDAPQGPGPGGRAGRGMQAGPARGNAPGPMGPGMMGEPPIERLLGLTEDQRTKFHAVMRGVSDQSAPLADELEFTRRSLHREAFADKRDDGKIAGLSAKVVSLEKQLLDAHVKAQTTLSELLTPEQRQTLRMHADVLAEPGLARRGPGRGRGGM